MIKLQYNFHIIEAYMIKSKLKADLELNCRVFKILKVKPLTGNPASGCPFSNKSALLKQPLQHNF